MTIKYEPSAAALSWVALSEAIDSRANMQEALFHMYAKNTDLALAQTKNQADSVYAELNSQATQQFVGGAASIAGAITSGAMVFYSGYKSNSNLEQADQLTKVDDTELKLKQVEPIEDEVKDLSSQDKEDSSPSKVDDKRDELPENVKAMKNQYEFNAKWWSENGNVFSNALNKLGEGAGGIATSFLKPQERDAKMKEVLAQGIASVLNSQGSLISSSLQSCDSYMQNANSTLSTIIQVSAVRA